MISLKRTFDYELVKRIVTHPEVYPYLADDGSPTPEDYRAIEHEAIYYVLVERDDVPVGVLLFVPQNAVCYEGHTALLPEVWGEGGKIGQLVIEWMFANTPCRRIVGNAPLFNHRALQYAKKAGMQPFGVNAKSYLKDGVLYDQIVLGISKEDVCHS